MATATGNFKAAVKKAKALYKTGRYNKFSDAVKAAYKKLPGKKRKKVSGVKAAKVKRSRVKRSVKKSVGTFVGNFVGSIASHKKAIKTNLENRLGKEYVSQTRATTKTARRKIGRQIAKTKRDLRKYC